MPPGGPDMPKWTALAISHVLAPVIFNVAHRDGGPRVRPPTLLLGITGVGLPLLAAMLLAAAMARSQRERPILD